MAERSADLENYLSCHLCSNTLTDPVSLSCNHSFCFSCLKEFWVKAEDKICPICKRRSSNQDPGVNFGLKEVADCFAGRQKDGSPEAGGEKKVELVCQKHPEEPRLFCKDEDRVLCPACEPGGHPGGHRVVPVEEAASEVKEQLKSDLKSLQDKRDQYQQAEKTYHEMIQHSKKQLEWKERKIRTEIKKFQQLLVEEEESRLAAVREEEETKREKVSREMEKIQEQISSLSQSISAVEEELQKHSVSFLSSYRDAQSTARAGCSASRPQLVSGALIHVGEHVGNLSVRVWERMKDKVSFSPVILDPNTAHGCLYLSDDLTSVRREGTNQQLPDNPERNTRYPTVLGSEGFSSGKHSWDVEVGDHPDWTLGLAKESVDRKGERLISPKHGIWCLRHQGGKYTNGRGQTVRVEKSPQRVRVQLDYDVGEVSFYDPEDVTLICTHRDSFNEKLFPYFYVGNSGDAKTSGIHICPRQMSVMFVEGSEV